METPEAIETPTIIEPPRLYALVADFGTEEELIEACKTLRDDGYSRWDAYTPYPVHGIDPAIGIKRTRLPEIVFCAGVTGCLSALLMQWYTNAYDYPFIISAKPYFSLPANIPIMFEVTVLFSAFTAFFGMLALNRLSLFYHPLFSSPVFQRATSDRLVIAVEAADPKFDEAKTRGHLASAGAVNIESCMDSRPSDKVPGYIWIGIGIAALLLMVPPAMVAKARASTSGSPPFRYDEGMAFQPKLKPQAFVNPEVFADGREQRLPVAGTVHRGGSQLNEHLNLGKSGGGWAKSPPMPVTPQLVKRGQERFTIYCSPCHGLVGMGNGPVAKRAEALQEGTWVPPTSLQADHVRAQPDGEIFNTITNGIRSMSPYGSRVTPEDRWAIITYVRALQISQNAKVSDVPPEIVPTLK
jgi:mono/diheme cytochrome c family protein